MSKIRGLRMALIAGVLFPSPGYAQVDLSAVIKRGEALYNLPASCAVCHKQDGTGLIGPDITYGPTAAQILEQMLNNPQMAAISQEIKASNKATVINFIIIV